MIVVILIAILMLQFSRHVQS